MLTADTKRNLAAAAVFALPIGFVLVAANMLGGGPTAAQAGPAPVPVGTSVAGPTAGPIVTEEMKRAVEHVARLDTEPFGPTPLYYRRRGEQPVEPSGDPSLPPPPDFVVQAILASNRGNTALINDDSYRVGDPLGETGWHVADIDAIRRSVTIEDRVNHRTRTRSVEGPSLDSGMIRPGTPRDRRSEE